MQASPESHQQGGPGSALVIALVGLAAALAVFAIWFQWNQTRRCLGFYGPAVARSVQAAPRVELWTLQVDATGRLDLADEQCGDEESGKREEEVDAEEPAAQVPRMEEEHCDHRETAQAIERGQVRVPVARRRARRRRRRGDDALCARHRHRVTWWWELRRRTEGIVRTAVGDALRTAEWRERTVDRMSTRSRTSSA